MTPAEESSHFCHNLLPDVSNHIRLLEILKLDENEAISLCCRLSTFALEDAPKYSAISYTWGSQDSTKAIIVNGTIMEVRPTCEYVLKQSKWYSDSGRRALFAGRRRYFWCDAICIDQTDSREKSFQVAMMGDIFKRAEEILCCVGEHDLNSKRIFSMLQSKSPFLTALVASRKISVVRRYFPSSLAHSGYKLSGQFREICHRHWTRGYDTLPPKRLIKPKPGPHPPFTPDRASQDRISRWRHKPVFVDPLVAFAKRPYFGRAWVYQELCFGSKVIVCCGNDRASLDHLRELVVYADSLPDYSGVVSGIQTYGAELGAAKDLVEVGVTKTKVSGWADAWLAKHMSRVAQLDCTDDRDRVYAILSLVPWAGNTTPVFPDYDRDKFHLAMDILSRLGGSWHISALVSWSLRLASRPSSAMKREIRIRDLRKQLGGHPAPDPALPFDQSLPTDLRDLCGSDSGLTCNHPGKPQWFGSFSGFRISIEDGVFTLEGEPHNDVGVQVECPHWYPSRAPEFPTDPYGPSKITVYLPMTARPGDWCLFIERSRHGRDLPNFIGLEWLTLIVRGNDDLPKGDTAGRFAIVGRGYAIQITVFGSGTLTTDSLLRGQEAFEVFCSAEDALILATSFVEGIPTAWHEGLLQRHLLTTVCGWPGSSFAIRSNEDPRSSEEKGNTDMLAWFSR